MDYHTFSNFFSTPKQDDVLDLPKFYPQTPKLAYTVFFSVSDIERLDMNPQLLTDFQVSSRKNLDHMYAEIKEEENDDLKEKETKEAKIITEITAAEQI